MCDLLICAYEAGFRGQIHEIRNRVFCVEQGIDPAIEQDGLDEDCMHVLAFENEVAIATGRIQSNGHIGRIAVTKAYRSRGVGTRVLEALVDYARQSALERVKLSSQVRAAPFYANVGFQVCGSPYVEAGIEHIKMDFPLR